MKRIAFFLLAFLCSVAPKAQTLTYVSGKETDLKMDSENKIDLKKPSKVDTVISLYFRVRNRKEDEDVTVETRDLDEGSANLNKDYKYDPKLVARRVLDGSTDAFNIDIRLLTAAKRSILFYCDVAGKNGIPHLYKILVNLNSDVKEKPRDPGEAPDAPDTLRWKMRIVTGGSFDFFSGPKIKDFAGNLNLFLPSVFKTGKFLKKNWLVGFQFDLFNYHYYESDSSGRLRNTARYYANAQDFFKGADSAKIATRTTVTNTKTDHNIWGGSINPTVLLASNEFSQLYANVHLEALFTTQITTYSAKAVSRDTTKLGGADIRKLVLGVYEPVSLNYLKRTYYDYYFGIGFPWKVSVKKLFDVSISPTVGVASIQFDPPVGTDQLSDSYVRGAPKPPRDSPLFFLTKFQIVTSVSPVDIALGGEYRAVFGQMHYLSLYIGAAITLDKLKR
jgi:hypothetical protein